MGLPITRTKALTASGATKVCASQTPLTAGNLTINGTAASSGVATLDTQRRILFTFAADESARTFTLYGTNQSGAAIQETIAGGAATAVSLFDYLKVTRIAIDAASAGAITVGTNGVGAGSWQSVNSMVTPVNVGIQLALTGTANFTIQGTNADVNTLALGTVPPTFDHPTLTGLTANAQGTWNDTVSFFRLLINSGTGSVQMAYVQSGLVG